jgi:threonine dehydratase
VPDLPVSFQNVLDAAARLDGVANRTPVMTSRTVNARLNAELFFKCENYQRAGAFKFRGAYNVLSQLDEAQRARGVLTYSSGNHAQATALASRLLGIQATIVMPNDAPLVKLEATRSYGAEVVLYDREETTREALARKMADAHGYEIVPPYDDPRIIAGQGTAALELFEDVAPLDLLVVCCGGGGLLSGSAISAKNLAPDCTVIGVEPENADDATRSFHTSTLHTVHNPDTIADGARTPSLGRYTFPIVLSLVDDMVTVSDEALVRTMRLVWERMKMVVEPTGVLGATAVLENTIDVTGKRAGILISGGNIDLERACSLFAGQRSKRKGQSG